MASMEDRFARIAQLLVTCPDCGARKQQEEVACRFCQAAADASDQPMPRPR